MDPITILAIGSLLSGFFGKKKKVNEAQKVQKSQIAAQTQNDINDLKFRSEAAARQDAIDKGNVDVLNQNSQADERNRVVRNQIAQGLLATLQPGTIDKDLVSAALQGNSAARPINYTVAPASVVAPSTVRSSVTADPGTGMIWDTLSGLLGNLAQSQADKKKAQTYNDAKSQRSGANLGWDPDGENYAGDN